MLISPRCRTLPFCFQPFRLVGWTLAFLLCSAGVVTASPRLDGEVLEHIEDACLHAYTPQMMAAMIAEGASREDLESMPQEELLEDFLLLDKGRFYPAFLNDFFEAFDAYVKPGTRFLDLGSGDGRMVFLAAALGAEAVGIEYDPEVFAVGERALTQLEDVIDVDRVELIEGDFFDHLWTGYDVIFYYDLSSFEQNRLRKKIAFELDPGAFLFVGNQREPFPGLELVTTFDSIHVYRQPGEMPHAAGFEKIARTEILGFHKALEDWRNGKSSEDDFDRLDSALARGFAVLGPGGRMVGRSTFVERLREERGSWSPEEGAWGGRIRVENLRLRLLDGPVAVFTFQRREIVRGEIRTTSHTAILRLRHGTPNGIEWYHLHSADVGSHAAPSARTQRPTQ